jgi:hypothetical protein
MEQPPQLRRRSTFASILGGAIVITTGLAVGIVEALRLPKGTLWIIVALAVVLLLAVRTLTRSR